MVKVVVHNLVMCQVTCISYYLPQSLFWVDLLTLNGSQLLYLLGDLYDKIGYVFKSAGKQAFGFRSNSDDSSGYEKLNHYGSDAFVKLTQSLVPDLSNHLATIAEHLEVITPLLFALVLPLIALMERGHLTYFIFELFRNSDRFTNAILYLVQNEKCIFCVCCCVMKMKKVPPCPLKKSCSMWYWFVNLLFVESGWGTAESNGRICSIQRLCRSLEKYRRNEQVLWRHRANIRQNHLFSDLPRWRKIQVKTLPDASVWNKWINLAVLPRNKKMS